ncbi:carbohydrate ABC transporter permease [Cohnella fermenti]|uniref:Carbohydrate ABC transporter permease n=1 Tax=Cohnella fermenti TaxID=2565925 RepID=A0A4S4BST3_9BACL|nr:carbohydrate ABC transporter permease [Cohnella fermenti]THF77560.1 carbohydrate ABC transporter permease [Cohnella fermenti]
MMTIRRFVIGTCKYGFLWLYATISLFLFAWIFASSFKSNREIFRSPFSLPENWTLDNYVRAWESANMSTYFWNSIFVASISVLFTLLFGSMLAYAIARFRFRGNALLSGLFVIGMAIPLQSLMLPTFLKMNELGLRNNLLSLILIYGVFGLPRAVFILVGFMKSIPAELEEAAIVDGCSYWRMYGKIIIPLSVPGMATLAILDFIGAWNEYVYASVLLATDKLRTLPIGLANFKGEYSSEYGLICAGIVITIIPVVIIYVFFQEQIVKGLSSGSVKG